MIGWKFVCERYVPWIISHFLSSPDMVGLALDRYSSVNFSWTWFVIYWAMIFEIAIWQPLDWSYQATSVAFYASTWFQKLCQHNSIHCAFYVLNDVHIKVNHMYFFQNFFISVPNVGKFSPYKKNLILRLFYSWTFSRFLCRFLFIYDYDFQGKLGYSSLH